MSTLSRTHFGRKGRGFWNDLYCYPVPFSNESNSTRPNMKLDESDLLHFVRVMVAAPKLGIPTHDKNKTYFAVHKS